VGSIPTHFRQISSRVELMPDSEGPFPDPVELPVEDALDLHAFSPKDIPSVVESYLQAASEAGFDEVRLIHGRGRGVQKRRVESVLTRSPLVENFAEAPPERGGWGATLVWLRSRKRV
jgi:DNA-nicking Smr family endonuclease